MASSAITIAVRVRPPTDWELGRLPTDNGAESFFMGDGSLAASPQKITSTKLLRPIVQVMDDKVLVFDPKDQDATRAFEQKGFAPPGTKRYKDIRYAFDRVFGEDARQVELYEGSVQPLLDGLFDGFNATVFAYGATGCGKTHTISGTDSDPGVIYLTMADLFQRIEDKKDDMICDVSLSFLEIYNEEVRDLLLEGAAYVPRGGLAMREDQNTRVTIPGLTEKHPKDAEEVKAMVMQGNERRTQSPTLANQTSSRSHAVLQVNVTQTPRTAGTNELHTMATLSIIDLAGSERASATTNMGQRMIEGANINKSLLALGNCINALCESGGRVRHIPYRNSKLTRLLRFSLGGNCRTVMIVCVAPASNHYEDTQNTLKYANRAKDIKTKVSRNFINVDRHVGQYVEAINRLNDEVAQLKAKLAGKLGGEATVQKRRKEEAKAELERVRQDLQSKADQTRATLIDGAACEAHIFSAKTRVGIVKSRLDQLSIEPSSSEIVVEQALLQSLTSSDESILEPTSAANRQIEKASNSNSMLDATLRAVLKRRSERLDEFSLGGSEDSVRPDVNLKRVEMDKLRAEARESVLKGVVESQAKFSAELIGLLARCTVLMADGGETLRKAFPESTEASSSDEPSPEHMAKSVAEAMARVAASNDEALTALIGQSTSAFQHARDSALLKFANRPSSSLGGPRARPSVTGPASRISHGPRGSISSKPGPRTSFSTARRRSSLGTGNARAVNSPRRSGGSSSAKSPRRPMRHGAGLAIGARRAAEKKSVRWRDETSQGEIDDKGLGRPFSALSGAAPSSSVSGPPVAPLVFVTKPSEGALADSAKPKEAGESEAEWEDERTDDNVSVASTSSSSTTTGAPIRPGARNRLDPGRANRLTHMMSSLGEVSEDAEGEDDSLASPRRRPASSSRAPLGDVLNSPPSGSRNKSSARSSPSKPRIQPIRPSTPPQQRPQLAASEGLSKSQSRRNSNIGPMRGKVSRRRSSLIPKPSPPSANFSYAYAQPRRTPSKKKRASVLSASVIAGGLRPPISRPAFGQSLSFGVVDSSMVAEGSSGGRKPAWR